MNIEEPSLCGSIVKALPHLGHVHFADSNRRFPGAGHIDFPGVVTTLAAVGYQNYISMEMLPWPDPEQSAGKAIQYLNQIFNYQLQGIES
jgi:sugar phosphate isomerase/epimerase